MCYKEFGIVISDLKWLPNDDLNFKKAQVISPVSTLLMAA